jgi:hypothetical protein
MADQQRFGISEPLSTAPATEADLKASATLKEYLQSRGMYESHAEASRREEVLGKLDRLVKQWVRDASAAKGFAEPFLSEVLFPYILPFPPLSYTWQPPACVRRCIFQCILPRTPLHSSCLSSAPGFSGFAAFPQRSDSTRRVRWRFAAPVGRSHLDDILPRGISR